MTEPRDSPEARALHEWSGGERNLPTLIYAPAPNEPSVTRGVTGLFVPMFLGLFIILAVYFFAGAWDTSQRLLRQQSIARDVTGLTAYIEDLESQNAELCHRIGDLPDRVERPTLQVQVQSARRAFDLQCQRNQQLQDRLSQSASPRCVAVTPEGRSQPRPASASQRQETLAEFRARICRSYAAIALPRVQP
jgi:hypothetical protein